MANKALNARSLDKNDIPQGWYKVSTLFGVLMIIRCWVPVLLLTFACSLLPFSSHLVLSLAGLAGIAFFIGVFQYHINILAHSGQHWQIAANRKTNDILTRWFLSASLLLPLKHLRRTHIHHHADIWGKDDEDRWYFDLEVMDRATPAKFNLWLLSMFCGATAFKHAKTILRKLRIMKKTTACDVHFEAPANKGKPQFDPEDLRAIITVQLVLFVAFWFLSGYVWAYPLLWLVPRFSIMTGLNAIRASIEHADFHTPKQPLKSFSSNAVERFFLAPFYMNYHGEHHAYMAVSMQHLPKLRKLFLESEHARDFEIVPSYWAEYKTLLQSMPKAGESRS